jgi:hypothetical protein
MKYIYKIMEIFYKDGANLCEYTKSHGIFLLNVSMKYDNISINLIKKYFVSYNLVSLEGGNVI